MLKFISFGSGSCGNSYYLYTEDYGMLIDAGIGVRKLKKNFIDYGLNMADIKSILVTHDHADHVKSVGSLSNTYGVPVYATEGVHNGIVRNYYVRKKIDACNVNTINKGVTFSLGEFSITAFTVPHDSSDNVGYQIKYGDITFCLITDAGYVTEEMAKYIESANYLVIEANHDEQMLSFGPYPGHLKARVAGDRGHLSNANCALSIVNNATSALRHVWLCHLSQENNHPELARKTVEMKLHAAERFDGTKVKLDVLRRNLPNGIYTLE
ncbi:MAG: MBL fold metallo-hydrolase [Prevotellaceae bacterium]|nr:MBL fold metallo-hydrolase [Prevotellaceae bacterium]